MQELAANVAAGLRRSYRAMVPSVQPSRDTPRVGHEGTSRLRPVPADARGEVHARLGFRKAEAPPPSSLFFVRRDTSRVPGCNRVVWAHQTNALEALRSRGGRVVHPRHVGPVKHTKRFDEQHFNPHPLGAIACWREPEAADVAMATRPDGDHKPAARVNGRLAQVIAINGLLVHPVWRVKRMYDLDDPVENVLEYVVALLVARNDARNPSGRVIDAGLDARGEPDAVLRPQAPQ
mmetsp:Transcript_62832/g.175070  ORF Transcript_62832/g.175070 Transcript_62832/m.175070 type:complete len:235 (-) Transcript_62832:3021-3725(-)